MKRKWPEFYKPLSDKHLGYIQLDPIPKLFLDWLEANLSKEELARIAPVVCEHENVISHHGNPMNLNYVRFYACHKCGKILKPTGWEEV